MPSPEPSLRADARRNREAIVAAAKIQFGRYGLSVPLEDVAAEAGVGIATLFRRFPSKLDLVHAVFLPELEAYVSLIEAGIAEPDSWVGFERTVVGIGTMQASNRALADVLAITPAEDPDIAQITRYGLEAAARLVQRTQLDGQLRPDFQPQDLPLIGIALAGVIHRSGDADPDSWRRMTSYLLVGLRVQPAD